MARQLYSSCVVDRNELDSFTGTWEVPAGYVFVVRDMVAFVSNDASPGGVVIQSQVTLAHIWYDSTPGSEAVWLQWQGRQVLEEGDGLAYAVYGDVGCSLRISGYLLTAP